MKIPHVLWLLLAGLASACAWNPWIPGENSWNPPVVVDQAELAHRLALDSPYVDALDCYSQRCRQRFRVIIEEPGQLTVTAMMELASQDEQGRMVLEAINGVLTQVSTGRGVRTDAAPLSLRHDVEPGVYFVLLQAIGGHVPYEITATHTPGEVAVARAPEARPELPLVIEEPLGPGPPTPKLTKVKLPGGRSGATYDPSVIFAGIETFAFPRLARSGDGSPPGTPVEQPGDRQIRRFIAEGLEMKGFRQASGAEESDLVVAFSTTEGARSYFFNYYGFNPVAGLGPVGLWQYDTGTLVVDIMTRKPTKLAWSAWTTKGLGPGITPGEKTAALVREAVTDVLAEFPPY
jgi:hypothetical protein